MESTVDAFILINVILKIINANKYFIYILVMKLDLKCRL